MATKWSFFLKDHPPPVVKTIEPEIAFWGDTVMITGENFDYTGKNNTVWFDEFEAKEKWGINDTIYAIVPAELNRKMSNIKVKLYGKASENSKSFEVHSPQIYSISKTEGQYPDTIEIKGKYFSPAYTQLFFGNLGIIPDSISSESMKFKVPFLSDGQNVDIKIVQLVENINVFKDFKYNKQEFLGFSKDSVWIGDSLTLYARNIDFRDVDVSVSMGDYKNFELIKKKDTLVFKVNDGCARSLFVVDVYLDKSKVYTHGVKHRAPIIKNLSDSILCYGDLLEITGSGLYCVELCYENISDKSIAGAADLYRGNNSARQIDLPDQMIPGKYNIWLDSNGRKSKFRQITIPVPLIKEVNIENHVRGRYDVHEVKGEYLPKRGTYLLKHQDSGRIFNVGVYDNYSMWRSTNVVGRGNYEFQFKFHETYYDSDIVIEFQDYLQFVKKLNHTIYPAWNSYAFVVNNKIYTKAQYSNPYSIDLVSGIKADLGNSFFPSSSGLYPKYTSQYPVFCNDKLYSIFDSKLYYFNSKTEAWEKEQFTFDNDTLYLACATQDKLQVFAKSGQSYIKEEGTWSEGPFVENFAGLYPRFAFSYNDDIYFWKNYQLYAVSMKTGKFEETYLPPVKFDLGSKLPQHLFIYQNELYFCYQKRTSQSPYVFKFSPDNKEYEFLNPGFLPQDDCDYKFAPDEKGNIYVLNGEYIYKFDPK